MVSIAVLTVILLVLVTVTSQTSSIWHSTTAKVEEFRDARTAFEAMTTRLAQATLNTYWDYDNPTAPTRFERRSELRFISGSSAKLLASTPIAASASTHCIFFQAPFGVTVATAPGATALKYDGFENLLCSWGYYLNYDSDLSYRPPIFPPGILPLRYRYRLMELWQPAEQNEIYAHTSGLGPKGPAARTYNGLEWFTNSIAASKPVQARVLAENVIALVLTPRLSPQDETAIKGALTSANADLSPLAPNYLYDTAPPSASGASDSRYNDPRLDPLNQLPPLVQVTMVAIDEASALRMNFSAGTHATDPFSLTKKFQDSSQYSNDLLLEPTGSSADNATSLEYSLIHLKLNYRIFSTNVMIRGAKWSRSQTK